jgi:hypothetical protein
MVKQKKERAKNPVKWIAVSGFLLAGIIFVLTFFSYALTFIENLAGSDFIFILKGLVQFIFSNNVLFAVIFVLLSVYLLKANKFARVLWIVLSAYFVFPTLISLSGDYGQFDIFTLLDMAINLFLVVSSLFLIFNKKIEEKFV